MTKDTPRGILPHHFLVRTIGHMTTTLSDTAAAESELLDVAKVRQLIHEDPRIGLLDVRTGGEYEASHIPGAWNVPLATLSEHVREFAKVGRPMILICQTGNRAQQAHAKLQSAGKQGLHVLEGGMNAWEAAGGDVVRGETTKWALDRQVRLVAGSLVMAGIAGSMFVPKLKFLSAGVGFGLAFSAVTNTCAMASMLARLPYNSSDHCDIDEVLGDFAD